MHTSIASPCQTYTHTPICNSPTTTKATLVMLLLPPVCKPSHLVIFIHSIVAVAFGHTYTFNSCACWTPNIAGLTFPCRHMYNTGTCNCRTRANVTNCIKTTSADVQILASCQRAHMQPLSPRNRAHKACAAFPLSATLSQCLLIAYGSLYQACPEGPHTSSLCAAFFPHSMHILLVRFSGEPSLE